MFIEQNRNSWLPASICTEGEGLFGLKGTVSQDGD
jgi:hypothetical protein